jgi:hypothetical protein
MPAGVTANAKFPSAVFRAPREMLKSPGTSATTSVSRTIAMRPAVLKA